VGPEGNLLERSVVKRGDADAALAASAHVVEGTWQTQRIEHLYLEPEACLAAPGDAAGQNARARVTLYTQGQGIFDDRRQVAGFLGLPEEDVHVVLVPNGGAFGGKEDMSVQAQTALLSRVTGRPVRLVLSREESMRIHPKRHPIRMHYRVGCDADGRLTAVRARMIGDSGAYASVGGKVLERAAGHAAGPYRCPNIDVEALAVYTNNPPCGAMRGFGANQAHFAMEGALDMLAEKAGLDRWEIRWRNALEAGDEWSCGQKLVASVGLKKTLLAVKDVWEKSGGRAGIACGIKNTGIGNGLKEWGRARLVVEKDGASRSTTATPRWARASSRSSSSSRARRRACPRPSSGRVDTRFPMEVGQTTGSRATYLGGRAVVDAATKLRADLDSGKRSRTSRARSTSARRSWTTRRASGKSRLPASR
jgi:CO/xanthine dehydrogenase Mo-binding subunit